MRRVLCRVLLAAASLVWLSGCMTTSEDNPFAKLSTSAKDASASADTTGSVLSPDTPPDAPKLTPELLGSDPNDELSLGKKYFRQGSYGLAENQFRIAAEQHPKDAEAWLGLAAS